MPHCNSLRAYLDALRTLGEVCDIDTEVDWHLEMGALIRRACEPRWTPNRFSLATPRSAPV
jgi:3-polyprenyl-4-hydroxybenzoate decarboxylase